MLFKLHIVERSPTRLTFQIRPLGVWIIMGGFLVETTILAFVFRFRGEMLLFAAAFLILGTLFLLLFGQITTCDFDRRSNEFRLRSQGFGRNKETVHSLSSVRQVQIQKSFNRGPTYRVVLILGSGQQVPLVFYYSGTYQDKLETAQAIATFLDIELLT